MSATSLLYQTFIICALFAIRAAEFQVCEGTTDGENIPGGHLERYEFLRTMYTNCTHVRTNLEIVYLRPNDEVTSYDLSFLRTIRFVNGYVLISGIGADISTMPLDNLQFIRARTSYSDPFISGTATLAVINNPGIQRLHLHKLGEIWHGNVLFKDNVNMKYVDRINWRKILSNPLSTITHINGYVYPDNATLNCTGGHGWDDNPLLCQEGLDLVCNARCDERDARCFGSGYHDCCSYECANGCRGSSLNNCTECRNYKNGDECVVGCPEGTSHRWPLCVPHGFPYG